MPASDWRTLAHYRVPDTRRRAAYIARLSRVVLWHHPVEWRV
jgi:hypothetical protein